ncbi:terminase small subunit [Mannheimia haemolytica]|nr:terminase small subunit [Mannheimia haemolytica]
MTELTPKQEAFCFAYIETGNASEAYRQAYETEDMKSETVHRKAKELMDNGKITARIEELKAEHAERHKLTVDDLLKELEEARILAREKENPNAMTQATMGKAKLLGLDKQVTDPCFDGETINDEAYQQILKGVLSSKSVTPRYKRFLKNAIRQSACPDILAEP